MQLHQTTYSVHVLECNGGSYRDVQVERVGGGGPRLDDKERVVCFTLQEETKQEYENVRENTEEEKEGGEEEEE